jgi:hypothetical protein
MTADPIIWRIKLQSSLEEDRNYYNMQRTHLRGRMMALRAHQPSHGLEYSKLREMLKEKPVRKSD